MNDISGSLIVSAKALCHNIMSESIPGSLPLFQGRAWEQGYYNTVTPHSVSNLPSSLARCNKPRVHAKIEAKKKRTDKFETRT